MEFPSWEIRANDVYSAIQNLRCQNVHLTLGHSVYATVYVAKILVQNNGPCNRSVTLQTVRGIACAMGFLHVHWLR